MLRTEGIIGPEDYLEPQCVLCGKTGEAETINPIPQQRVIEKLDAYTSRHDYDGAVKHLEYWMKEAVFCNDQRGELLISNEFMGVYRKINNEDKAVEAATNALSLLKILEMEDTITAATTYINAGTVYDAFNKPELAEGLFERALKLYDENLFETDERFGGLYNNMGLAKVALKKYGEAYECFTRAIEIMKQNEDGMLDTAISYLNLANAVEEEHGLEKAEQKIYQCCDCAEELLFDERVKHDGYCAFVYEKCAPTFEYYGYFLTAEKLKKESKELYARA